MLYLAVLDGKNYSGNHNRCRGNAYITRDMFSVKSTGNEDLAHENQHALNSDNISFENMLAHAIFCASRRSGVQGIPVEDFFGGLLDEFQHES